MPFDFTASKPETQLYTTTSGNTPVAWRLLGEAGFNVLGKGRWLELNGVQWKSFLLRAHTSPHNAAIGAGSVEIQVANELDPVDADENTKFVVLATLDSSNPEFSSEEPWRYVRARVAVVGTPMMQVDFYGISV